MLQVHRIPAFKDNYFWLIQPDNTQPEAHIVDPGDAAPVKKALANKGLQLKSILLTHHHHDHVDGAQELSQSFGLPIYGPPSARMPQVTQSLLEGDIISLGHLDARVIALPGHTLDHIGYFIAETESADGELAPRLFSGDTLFAAGCGRLFDGTAPLLFAALNKIAALPDQTLIYAAHEYTLANLEFARFLEPENHDLIVRQELEAEKRAEGQATLPTRLCLEKRTNPFLRCHLNTLKERAETLSGESLTTSEAVFASLRRVKDNF